MATDNDCWYPAHSWCPAEGNSSDAGMNSMALNFCNPHPALHRNIHHSNVVKLPSDLLLRMPKGWFSSWRVSEISLFQNDINQQCQTGKTAYLYFKVRWVYMWCLSQGWCSKANRIRISICWYSLGLLSKHLYTSALLRKRLYRWYFLGHAVSCFSYAFASAWFASPWVLDSCG